MSVSKSTRLRIGGYRHTIHDHAPDVSARHTVLALHGFGTSGAAFRQVAQKFADRGVRTVAPDQLGFGSSDKPVGVYSLDLFTKLTRDIADGMTLDRPVLLGHSAGGKIAAATVARYPDRFRALVLVNSGGFSAVARVLLLFDTPLFYVADTPLIRNRILRRFNVSQAVERPEQWEAFRRIRGNNRALDIDAAGYREAVRRIEIPVLLLWGLKDRMLPRGTPKRILRDLPHADYIPLPDSGHTPFRDEPETFCDHVVRFANRFDRTS